MTSFQRLSESVSAGSVESAMGTMGGVVESTSPRTHEEVTKGVACHTLRLDGGVSLSSGITISDGAPVAVYCGSRQHGGWGRFMPFTPYENEEILLIGQAWLVNWTNEKIGKSGWSLRSPGDLPVDPKQVLLRIETGHRSLLSTKISHGAWGVKGTGRRIEGGTLKSRMGFEVSREELWLLSGGDELFVTFASGAQGVVRVSGIHPEFFPEKPIDPRQEAWEGHFEAIASTTGTDAKAFACRSYHRYELMKMARGGRDWEVIYDHFMKSLTDISTKVCDTFVEMCPYTDFTLRFGLAWKNRNQAKPEESKNGAGFEDHTPKFLNGNGLDPEAEAKVVVRRQKAKDKKRADQAESRRIQAEKSKAIAPRKKNGEHRNSAKGKKPKKSR